MGDLFFEIVPQNKSDFSHPRMQIHRETCIYDQQERNEEKYESLQNAQLKYQNTSDQRHFQCQFWHNSQHLISRITARNG